MQSADHLLVNTFGNIIADIGWILLDLSQSEKWKEEKDELFDQARSYIHQPEWFIHYAKEVDSNMSFDALVEAVAKIGIKSLQINNEEIAKESIKILSAFARDMLSKEKGPTYGYTEPRIMVRACHVGILALKLKKQSVIVELKSRIEEFQKAYKQKWFRGLSEEDQESMSPKKEQMQSEIMELRDEVRDKDYDHTRGVLDSSEDRLLEEIEVIDIDRFTYEIWNFFESGSALEKELGIIKKAA